MAKHIIKFMMSAKPYSFHHEPGAFVMWIVDSRFSRYIMNIHRRPPSHLHDFNNMSDVADLLLSVFIMKNVDAHQKVIRRARTDL